MNPTILARLFAAKQGPQSQGQEPIWGPDPYAHAGAGGMGDSPVSHGVPIMESLFNAPGQTAPSGGLSVERDGDVWPGGPINLDDPNLRNDPNLAIPGGMSQQVQENSDRPMPPTGTQQLDRIEEAPGGPIGVMYDPETDRDIDIPMSRLPPGIESGANIYPGDVRPLRGGRMTSR